MNMKTMLAFLPLLAAPALAQEDVYKALDVGDRVQITFRNGNTIIGSLVVPPTADPKDKAAPKDPKMSGPAQAPFTLLYFHQDN